MNNAKKGYWSGVFAALLGRPPEVKVESGDGIAEAELRSRIASLELDLRERDEKMNKMRHEYEHLHLAKDHVSASAGQEQIQKIFKQLAGPMSNLIALTTMAEAGQDVSIDDLVQLIKSLSKKLAQAGMEPIGSVGERTQFDVKFHQRMSGSVVRPGTRVIVRIGGYRLGDTILMKAMVTAEEGK